MSGNSTAKVKNCMAWLQVGSQRSCQEAGNVLSWHAMYSALDRKAWPSSTTLALVLAVQTQLMSWSTAMHQVDVYIDRHMHTSTGPCAASAYDTSALLSYRRVTQEAHQDRSEQCNYTLLCNTQLSCA